MPKELQPLFDGIGSIFDSAIVQFSLRAIAIYFVVLWLAAAYWAFRDLQSRTDNPIAPYLAAALIVVATPLLFPFAIVVYRIVRPHERLGEVYERNLAEEALLAEVEAIHHCPGCSRRVNDEWIICPTCRTRLNRVCPNCSRLVGLDWSLCAWCGKDFERREVAASLEPLPGGLEPHPSHAAPDRSAVRASIRTASRVRAAASSAAVPSSEPLPEH
jgi:RNA polymerase subunit RPABC4/transcription elongation factor Spt4